MKYHKIALVGVLAALVAISAFIRIPTPFVPFSMQTFVVLLAAMIFGAKISFAAMILYLSIGLIGFPIFANGGGPAYVLQPTFGYLIGFALSVIPVGIISNKKHKLSYIIAAGVLGIFIIHLAGILGFWLNMNYVQHKDFTLIKSFIVLASFIAIDFVKLAIVSVIVYSHKLSIKR